MQAASTLMLFVALIKLTSFTEDNSLINNYINELTPNMCPYYNVSCKQKYTAAYMLRECPDILMLGLSNNSRV
jgi:hypothetical protein